MAADPDYLDAADRLEQAMWPRPASQASTRVATGSKVLALTFDDGPSRTPLVADVLKGEGVKATSRRRQAGGEVPSY